MNKEQRSYYRISDKVLLNWEILGPGLAPENANQQLIQINNDISRLIRLALKESAIVGEALGLLNNKIDYIVREQAGVNSASQLVKVNLSGSGIGFGWDGPAPVGTRICITMLLYPGNTEVSINTDIIDCKQDPQNSNLFWIRGTFDQEQELAIEQVVRHVTFKQTEQFAEQRRAERRYDYVHGDYEDGDEDEDEDEDEDNGN